MSSFNDHNRLNAVMQPLRNTFFSDKQFRDSIASTINLEFLHLKELETNSSLGRNFSGFVWNELKDKWCGVVMHKEPFKHTLISRFNGAIFIVRGYPQTIEGFDENDENALYFPKYNGVLISTYIMPNGVFWGKTKEIEYIDRNGGMNVNFLKILKDLEVADKLDSLSREYGCVVHGILSGKELGDNGTSDYQYVALDINDASNNVFYTKEASNAIFREFGISYEQPILRENIEEALKQYNGVVSKVYSNGELIFRKKEIDNLDSSIKYKNAVRDAHAHACDFCWTNPAFDHKLNLILKEHKIEDKDRSWLRQEIHNPKLTSELKNKVYGYLDGHYSRIKGMSASDVYEELKWKWEWSGLDSKEIITTIVEGWKESLSSRNISEISEMEKRCHSDSIKI